MRRLNFAAPPDAQTLFAAMEKGGTTTLRRAFSHPKSVLVGDRFGNTPLLIAAKNGFESALRFLLTEKGQVADEIDVEGYTPLHLALPHLPCVRLLIKHGADILEKSPYGASALEQAMISGLPLETIIFLHEQAQKTPAGARDSSQSLLYATQNKHHEAMAYFLGVSSTIDVLHLRAGEDDMPLLWACGVGDRVGVSMLLAAGADPLQVSAPRGIDGFCRAAERHAGDNFLCWLLDQGVGLFGEDVHARIQNALYLTACLDYGKVSARLVQMGANPHTASRQDANGNSELLEARCAPSLFADLAARFRSQCELPALLQSTPQPKGHQPYRRI